jgi:hypothetical protein
LALLALILLGPLFLFATPLSWLAMNWAMLLLLEAWLLLMAAVIGALVGTERSVLTLLDGHLRRWVAWFAPDPEPLWLHWARHAHYPQMAGRYLDRAARLGGAEALFQEGLVFLEGGFGMGGESTAVERFRKAAALGHAEAAFRLAEALRTGSSAIGRNPVEAETWYRRAAAKGFGPAAAWLAQAYLHGDGVGLDADQASHWAALAEQLRPYPPLSHNLLRHDAAPVDPLVAFTRDCLTALERGVAHLVSHRAGRWVLVVAAVLFAVLGVGVVGVFSGQVLQVCSICRCSCWPRWCSCWLGRPGSFGATCRAGAGIPGGRLRSKAIPKPATGWGFCIGQAVLICRRMIWVRCSGSGKPPRPATAKP